MAPMSGTELNVAPVSGAELNVAPVSGSELSVDPFPLEESLVLLPEEAVFLCYGLSCLVVMDENNQPYDVDVSVANTDVIIVKGDVSVAKVYVYRLMEVLAR